MGHVHFLVVFVVVFVVVVVVVVVCAGLECFAGVTMVDDGR